MIINALNTDYMMGGNSQITIQLNVNCGFRAIILNKHPLIRR